jgi:hypothetical protein
MRTFRPLAAPRLADALAVGVLMIPILLYAACADGGPAGNHDTAAAATDDPPPDFDLGSGDGTWHGPADAAAVWAGIDATSPAERRFEGGDGAWLDAAAGNDETSTRAPRGPPDGHCVERLAEGVLVIDELMIASVAGTGDYGEWLEVMSTSDCAVNLNGLHGDSPVGTRMHSFDITSDTWLLPHATFVVADSSDPVIDHDLPGPLVAWNGQPADVLRNLGGTVTLTAGSAIVDALTYPSLKPRIGASVAFPADCPSANRRDFRRWQTSLRSWFPGFEGTPNAPNDDVHCP